MGMQLKVFGVLGLIGLGSFGMSEIDVNANYIETDAKIISINAECTVRNGSREVIDKRTNQLAVMDCNLARQMAMIHGLRPEHVRKHHRLRYEFTSPIDGSKQVGGHVIPFNSDRNYKQGQTIRVSAHTSLPESYVVF